jgi:hypothetical protein
VESGGHADRGGVGGVDDRADEGDAEVVEGVGDAGAPGFGGVAPAPVGGGEVVADLDQPAAVDGLEGEPQSPRNSPVSRCSITHRPNPAVW